MLYGLDSLNPPTATQAKAMFKLGWRWYCCYVGGPRAAAGHMGWPNTAVHRIADAGFLFMPTYVGRTVPYDAPSAFTYGQGLIDGDEATVRTGACGFDRSTPLALDCEYGNWQANHDGVHEYVRGWSQEVNAAGHKAILYTDMETANHFDSSLVDGVWVAAYVRGSFSTTPPLGRFDPSVPPPWDAWQYSGGGGVIAGVTVDLNSARDGFELAQYTPPA